MSQESSILARYVETRSEDAFRALVDRYINVVYAAARRQTSDSHMAEDVTQAVFILLSQKAASVPLDRPLSAWLLKTTAYCAANVRRARDRRLRFEQKAAAMAQTTQDPSSSADSGTWESIAPMLDEGLGRLRSGDRDILLLRFFEGQDLAQIAEKLGVSKDAASKRISRAVEELRRFFQKRGVRMSAAALVTMLAIKVTEAAPRHLVVMLSAKVGAGAQAALPITALPSKSAIAAGIMIFAGAGFLLFHQLSAQTPASTTNTVSPAARPGRWSARFADGTVVEILGIREEPSIDNRWWGPDGATVPPPGDRFTRNSAAGPIGLRGIRLALQARRLDLTDTSVTVQVGAAANVSSSMVDQGNTRVISLVAIPLPGVDHVTVEVGTASGKWKQVALYDVKTSEMFGIAAPLLQVGTITADKDKTTVQVFDHRQNNLSTDYSIAVVANGRTIASGQMRRSLIAGTFYTFDCPKEEVGQVVFRERDYEMMEMTNVSTKPTTGPTDVKFIKIDPTTAPSVTGTTP